MELTRLAGALRWTGLVLAVVAGLFRHDPPSFALGGLALMLCFVALSVFPPRVGRPTSWRLGTAAAQAAVCVAVVCQTGGWDSPFILALGGCLLAIGLDGGGAGALAGGLTAAFGLGAAWVDGIQGVRSTVELAGQRAVGLALVAVLGVYSRRIMRADAARREGELARLRAADEVANLLLQLHARAASEPSWLTLRAALESAVTSLREPLSPDRVALFLRQPAGPGEVAVWEVVMAEGAAVTRSIPETELPPALAEAGASHTPVRRLTLPPGEGVSNRPGSGLYAPLWTRGALVGVLAVERGPGREPFSADDAVVAGEVAEHAALAIDNARRFRQLSILAAEEERGRIARELHDRVGQTLAAAAISLDRLGAEAREGAVRPAGQLGRELLGLADDLRSTVRGIRETLSDLRTDTSERVDLLTALAEFLDRVQARSGISTRLDHDALPAPRLAPLVEHEVWRIAQEAITNAERHARAHRICVRWHNRGDTGLLEVLDDGAGMASTAPLRRDAFGLLGMRERAEAIGARLAVTSTPGEGTAVRLTVERSPA